MTTFARSPVKSAKLLKPGEYMAVLDNDNWSVFKCHSCGHATSLSRKKHHVRYDGKVTPDVSCPHRNTEGFPCRASSMIHLDEWVPEAKGSA